MNQSKINLKSKKEIEIMAEGGRILNEVMRILLKNIDVGISMIELDKLAESEIRKRNAAPSFQMVPGYKWSICACVNEIVVHGIPDIYQARPGDVVGIDLGVYYKGFHTDCSWTVHLIKDNDGNEKIAAFLDTGKIALDKAIEAAIVGNYIYDISRAIQTTVEKANYFVVKSLIGHGIGRNLHEPPEIPGFIKGKRENTAKIEAGLTMAIEVIYNLGTPEVDFKREDGWTIQTRDGKISGLFEATVAATDHGVILLTEKNGT